MIRKILIKAIGAYKIFLSPIIGRQCRFFPSCSDYAREALERHNLLKALGLSLKRFLRCQPWNPGGVDLVP